MDEALGGDLHLLRPPPPAAVKPDGLLLLWLAWRQRGRQFQIPFWTAADLRASLDDLQESKFTHLETDPLVCPLRTPLMWR